MSKAQKTKDFIRFYDFRKDREKYPDAWCYAIVGGRNTGKTYSTLKCYAEDEDPIIFTKRTNKDIDSLCSGNRLGQKEKKYKIDLSPYKAINRDTGRHLRAYKIIDGLGAFYEVPEGGEPAGVPFSYLASLHAVNDIKGFDLTECEACVFDEFIPQPWSRIDRKEGEQLMELYKTVSRARVLQGRGELKLILLANAVNIWNPTLEVLGLIDQVAEMSIKKIETWYDPVRKIFIRILETPEEMMEAEHGTGMYETMKDTEWGHMAYDNEFGYNDFSRVRRIPLKGFRPRCKVIYKQKTYFIYQNENGSWYMCKAASNAKGLKEYNLKEEMHQRLFWYDFVIDIINDAMEGRAYFETYSMYDIIVNYKKRFKL